MLINSRETFFRYKKLILYLIFIFLLFGIIFLGIQCFYLNNKVQVLEKQINSQNGNAKIISFLNLFIKKVLQTDTEISFEDRLKLENAVRDLNDNEVLSLWETFTQATTADEVQKYCKDLLEVLVRKLS